MSRYPADKISKFNYTTDESDEMRVDEERIMSSRKDTSEGREIENMERDWEAQKKVKVGIKRKYNMIESDEEDESEERISEKLLWKLVKPKFIYTFKLCKKCGSNLFHDPRKFQYNGNQLKLSIMFCPACVKLNIDATDLLENTASKGKYHQRGRK